MLLQFQLDTQQIYMSTLYIKFHQLKHYIHLKIPIYKNQEKLIHDFILYTRNLLHTKWKTNIEQWGVSIKINNENEKYTLHFIFHTNILHIKFSWIHVMENNIKTTYQLVRRQET